MGRLGVRYFIGVGHLAWGSIGFMVSHYTTHVFPGNPALLRLNLGRSNRFHFYKNQTLVCKWMVNIPRSCVHYPMFWVILTPVN